MAEGYRKLAVAGRAMAAAWELMGEGLEELAGPQDAAHQERSAQALPPEWAALPPVLSVDEVAAFLGISRERAYDSIKAGEIPALRFGRRVKVPRHALRVAVETGRVGADAGGVPLS